MLKKEDTYAIGRIGKPHGTKGEVMMNIDDDVFDRTDSDYVFLEIDGLLVPFFFEEYRFKSDYSVIAKFEGVDNLDQARELTNSYVFFPRSGSDDNQPSWAEIVGYHVVDTLTGNDVGTIRKVDDTTLNLLFDVVTADGRTLLLPAHESLITEISPSGKTVKMALPEGLLEL